MTTPTLEALSASRPEWQPWLRLYGEARVAALDAAAWVSVARDPSEPTGEVPLLADATIALDPQRAGHLARALLGAAADGLAAELPTPADVTDDTALSLLGAAVADDAARLCAVAEALDVESGALGVVAGFAAMPVLHVCRRSLAAQAGESWTRGYCPLCGAWPALAEARGVERSRRFRCARCGIEWYSQWLRCPYCENANHTRLSALVGAETGPGRRVDTCEACRGYVKTLSVLRPTPPEDIPLADLVSVELDVAALEHGYRRPTAPPRLLPTRVVPR
jgi:FdhE protein